MKKLEDILLSIGGAIVVAAAVYFIDKQLAEKQAALAQQQTNSLSANDYTEQQELLAAFSSPLVSSGDSTVANSDNSQTVGTCEGCANTSSSSCNCSTSSGMTASVAQQSIAQSLSNLVSMSYNNYTNYNTTTVPVDTGTTSPINFNSYATNNAPTVQAQTYDLSLAEIPTQSNSGVNVQATIPVAYNHTSVSGN